MKYMRGAYHYSAHFPLPVYTQTGQIQDKKQSLKDKEKHFR